MDSDIERINCHIGEADIAVTKSIDPINVEDYKWPQIPIGRAVEFIENPKNVEMEDQGGYRVLCFSYDAESFRDEVRFVIGNYFETGRTDLMAYKEENIGKDDSNKQLEELFDDKIENLIERSEEYYSEHFGLEF